MKHARLPRVVLLTSPGAYGAIIINVLAKQTGLKLVGVGLTNRVYRGKGLLGTIRTSVQRTGWRYTLYNALAANVAWTSLRLRRRPSGLAACDGNVRLIDDINSAETIAWLKAAQPDYVASFYFNQWIGAAVREVPELDCVNLHPSLLPELRGPDPAFRTLERGLTHGGLTIHRVADEFDAGTILSQRTTTVSPESSVFSLYCDWAEQGAQFLGEWLASSVATEDRADPLQREAIGKGMLDQELSPSEQNQHSSPVAAPDDYQTFPSPAEVKAFLDKGGRLIDLREFRRRLREIT